MSYEKEVQQWLKRQGVSCKEEAQGAPHEASEEFIKKDSEMDSIIRVEMMGKNLRIYDRCGWSEIYKTEDVRALVKTHGQLASWEDFERLGELDSKEDENS